jgi:hypothetical protein
LRPAVVSGVGVRFNTVGDVEQRVFLNKKLLNPGYLL